MAYLDEEQRRIEEERQQQAQNSMQADTGRGYFSTVIEGGLPSQEEIDRRRAEVEERQRQTREAMEQYNPTADRAINHSLFNKKNDMEHNIDLGNYAVASDIADSYLRQLQSYADHKRDKEPVEDYREDFLQQKEAELAKRMSAELNRQRLANSARPKNIEEGGEGVRVGAVKPFISGQWNPAAQDNEINPHFDEEWAQELSMQQYPNGVYAYRPGEIGNPFGLTQQEFNNGLSNLSEWLAPFIDPAHNHMLTLEEIEELYY